MGFFNQPSRQFDSETGLLKGWERVEIKDGVRYLPKGAAFGSDQELTEKQYQDLVKKKTSKVDITNIPQSDADPKGTRLRKQVTAAAHNLAYENPEFTGLLSEAAIFMGGIGRELKQSAQDPNEKDIGKRLLGTFLTAEDWTIQQSAKGAQMWATGADIYNPWTKEQIGSLPDLNIDPTLASVAGGAAAGIVTGNITDTGVRQLSKLKNIVPPSGGQLAYAGIAVTDSPGLLKQAALNQLPSSATPLQIASNMQAPGWQGSVRTLLKSKNTTQIKKILSKPYHKTLSKKYQYMSLDDLSKNKGNWLEILMGKADVVKKDLSDYRKLQSKGISKNRLATEQRKAYDKLTVNPLFKERNIYDNPIRQKVAETFNAVLGKEWHHVFGNKEAAEFMLSQVAQDPYIAVNLIHHLKRLDVPTGGTASNIALMNTALHRKKGGFHSWYKKLGGEAKGKKKGVLQIDDYGQAISKAILSGDTEIDEIFSILEVYAKFNKYQRKKLKADFGAEIIGEMGPVMKFIEGA